MSDQDVQSNATTPAKMFTNVNKATVVGVGVGGGATPIIAWASNVIEAKYGIPSFVSATVLGAAAGFFMRWAAKLEPHE